MDSHRKRLSTARFRVALILLHLISCDVSFGVASDGSIGCLYSPSLCTNSGTVCFDDHAFGHCVKTDAGIEDLYRYDLSKEELNVLEREMQRLFSLGYRWSHTYTQCVLQAILFSVKTRTEYEYDLCDRLKDQDLDAALKAIESETDMQVEPENTAYVKFTPSLGDPHADFADEVYIPPLTPEDLEEVLALPGHHYQLSPPDTAIDSRLLQSEDTSPFLGPEYETFPYSLLKKKSSIPADYLLNEDDDLMVKRLQPKHFSAVYNTPEHFRSGYESRDDENDQPDMPIFINSGEYGFPSNIPERPLNSIYSSEEYPPFTEEELIYPENLQLMPEALDERYLLSESSNGYFPSGKFNHFFDVKNVKSSKEKGHHKDHPMPLPLKTGKGEKGLLHHLGYSEPLHAQRHVQSVDEPNFFNSNPEYENIAGDAGSNPPRGYTEGGMVFLPNQHDKNPGKISAEESAAEEEAISELLSGIDPALGWGFKRRERLDVKKPGPFFSTNNYAFEVDEEKKQKKEISADAQPKHQPLTTTEADPNDGKSKELLPEEMYNMHKPENLVGMPAKKELSAPTTHPALDPERYDIVDLDYVYIGFQDSIREWRDGDKIVKTVERLLNLPKGTFNNVRVDRNEVTFKVDPKRNKQGMNASDVVKKIEGIKDKLKHEADVVVTSAGIGNKTKLPPQIMPLLASNDEDFYILSFILIGVVGAVVVSAAALYVIRRHALSREKLQNITAPDTEASKDYQDLCRARMTGAKPPQEATPAAQRIASLSRESDNSPSSRSSTSSWSEEPALTNMDISTGHMVLSYMEDHLRNKDRLEREWAALCAYEAEPCATTIAQRPENTKKNRYVNALPYDHARVILNELSNISGSDYINASTITDHDPRNPAYIATQGALPHTTPDLWQMVWEQGCVVMVMLTRLIENDHAMCHRYWPEEGSELYHIYEVHLVSEHIWCDDYLVRSFYLKNLKTGETRTVTQFHFLSWPDGGVPSSIKALLEFRRKVNKSFRGRSCPIVVHCSDGVGRTGTYCLLDMVLNRMAKGAKEIDIAATLEHIRDQRMGSVATKQQFQLVLGAVAEEVQAILRVLPQQQTAQQTQQEGVKQAQPDEKK